MQNVIQRDTARILGGKTGFTDEAGTCIAVYFKSNGHEMLVITLKAPQKAYQAYHIEDALD
ncbi:MAG: D-alanyl-D-alanine carboxypeptidase, partial [Clostridia bacterium]|nr:D-alanyl-D-alanine carboxypeptidase [Clostridia bacterium]